MTVTIEENNIRYYEERLELVKSLFLEGQKEILLNNRGQIANLVQKYDLFRNDPKYDPTLAKFPETFLGIN